MLFLKILLISSLFLSDLMVLYSSMKYTATHGDPKVVEQAKMQLQWSFIINCISAISLMVLHLFEGSDFLTYSAMQWGILYASGGAFIVAIFALLLGSLMKKPSDVTEERLFLLAFGSFTFAFFCFHLFLSLIQF